MGPADCFRKAQAAGLFKQISQSQSQSQSQNPVHGQGGDGDNSFCEFILDLYC